MCKCTEKLHDIYLIRHGKTTGNIEKRYVGSTDEGLCEAGITEINGRRDILLRSFSVADEHHMRSEMKVEYALDMLPKRVYVSPMLRCRQTAELLFPGVAQKVVADLREMDFGQYEYKNYKELMDDIRYQAFIDSGGQLDFPGAEPQRQFRNRIQTAFLKCMEEEAAAFEGEGTETSKEPLVFVIHGGTIMAIMEKYARPRRGYFDWQTGAVRGYRCVLKRQAGSYYLEDVTEI